MHGSILPVTITPWGNVHQHVRGVAKFIERLVQGVGNINVHTREALGLAREPAAKCFPPNPRLLLKIHLHSTDFFFTYLMSIINARRVRDCVANSKKNASCISELLTLVKFR